MKFFSAVQSISARNLRVFYGIRSITLIIILRVSFASFKFRSIVIEAHMIKLFIFLFFFSLSCRIWQYGRIRHSYNKILFIILFKCLVDTRNRLRF
jgi:hypothetical protein